MQTLRYGGEQRRQTTMTKQICINSCLSPIWEHQQMTSATVLLKTSWQMKQPLEREKKTGYCFLFVADIMADSHIGDTIGSDCRVMLLRIAAIGVFCSASSVATIPDCQTVTNRRHTISTRRDNVHRAEDTLCS